MAESSSAAGRFYHTISEAGRVLPSASRWNSVEIDFRLVPQLSNGYDSIPSPYSKSYDYELVITDKKYLKRFLYISLSTAFLILALILLLHFVPHKNSHHNSSNNLTLAVNHALTFFDVQKSGNYPSNSPVKFRGSSGLQDGKWKNLHADLVGGFYDSGNNIKFTFPTAYTITLLSWSVIEYHKKYEELGEVEHVKDIIRWGSQYLLKVFVYRNATGSSPILYSQVGSSNDTMNENDISCWQRPEDMKYNRGVSVCDVTASDLAGEIIASLAAASLVFKQENEYSASLVKAAEKLYEVATNETHSDKQVVYTSVDRCGMEARQFYNSTGFKDELVWAGIWLFLATGNTSYLEYATGNFNAAADDQAISDKGIFYWNNKFPAIVLLLTRIRFFHDPGFPYEHALGSSSNVIEQLMCFYLSHETLNRTQGGLIFLKPDDYGGALQFAATASFLSKLYSDYLSLLQRSGGSCGNGGFSRAMLRRFAMSQINYILGENPKKMSYVVGFGDKYPTHVHHRSASIPWDGRLYSCSEGHKWLSSKDPNPNTLLGAMVTGPDQFENFIDERDKPWFTQPSIASNAGLVAALIALHESSSHHSSGFNLGIDQTGIFEKVHVLPSTVP
ncbi:endoglucanase 25-like [Carica papaya]|uniref:endoglucanase 25-like n=1 Tax=Carica papaya TaxID=3649 RepID=UPI000B8C822E|nr:endoglucanase 25-like [Carica papaya]